LFFHFALKFLEIANKIKKIQSREKLLALQKIGQIEIYKKVISLGIIVNIVGKNFCISYLPYL